MKVSILTPTVSSDYPIWAQPETHILTYVPDVLAKQDVNFELELVIVDALRDHRHNFFRHHNYPFAVYHLAPEPYPARWTNHCRMRNTGLAAANGDVIVQLDDTISMPDPHLLQHLVDELEQGWCVSPLVRWMHGDRVDGTGDWRWGLLDERGCSRLTTETEIVSDPAAGKIGFGVMAYPRAVALAIGGYCELYDGGVQFSDNDFGVRLAQAAREHGLRGIAIDRNYVVHHEAHDHPDLRVVSTYGPNGVLKCNRMLYHWRKERNWEGGLDEALLRAFEHCPYFFEALSVCSAGGQNNDCPVPNIAQQGPREELRQWIASTTRTF